MAKDADYKRLIHRSRWIRLRRQILSDHPSCQQCMKDGYLTAACEVHHIIPVESGHTLRERETLMYDRSNLMALCHRCHVEIHRELGRSGKEVSKRRNEDRVKAFNEKFFG